MKYTILMTLLVAGSAFAIENRTTICEHGDKQRKIDLVYPEQTEVPCEVQYTKDSGMQVLWSAVGESGYCESKYQAFVEKQEGWGWSCQELAQTEGQGSEEAMEEEPTEEGDTSQ
ncbi:hypothetical protein [Pleionea sediminis]|uniref:hypothetical protein n=1 Tax=Pleionea sediminis TaxID=2569479 RepID=UPI00197B7F95|nr:hypothetical protein [Pleionea sediminis]